MSTQLPSPPSPPTLSPDEIARLNALAVEVPIADIIIGERIRKDFSHVPELAESIREEGLIQPIVLTYDRRLIAGESRIRAHILLDKSTIRAVFRGVLDDAQLGVLEATENTARKNLTWQERCLSIDKVHRIHSTQAILSGRSWGVRETGKLLNQKKSPVGFAIFIAEFLHANDKEIWSADSMNDAYRILCERKEKEANAAVVAASVGQPNPTKYVGKPVVPPSLTDDEFFADGEGENGPPTAGNVFGVQVSAPSGTDEMPGAPGVGAPSAPGKLTIPLSRMFYLQPDHTSLLALQALGLECTDHIITDPPYAIDMDNLAQQQASDSTKASVASVATEHDVGENLRLLDKFIPIAYDALRPRGFLVFWCDPTHWWSLTQQCEAAGFGVQRWPLIWLKTSNCSNQAAQTNWTKNVEFAVVARKGVATLVKQQPSCVWTGSNDLETRLLGHPFAKPFGLWKWLYDAVAIRGQTVLDPFAGCGSSAIPAIKNGLRPIGIECNETHYGRLVVNVQNAYKSLAPDCDFS